MQRNTCAPVASVKVRQAKTTGSKSSVREGLRVDR